MSSASATDAARAARDRAKRALEAMKAPSSVSSSSSPGSASANAAVGERASATREHHHAPRSDACFDWSRGSCARGAECRFAHDGAPGRDPNAGFGGASSSSSYGGRDGRDHHHRSATSAAGVCFDHAKGACRRGDACRFSHDMAAVAAFSKMSAPSLGGAPPPLPPGARAGVASIPKPLPIVGATRVASSSMSSLSTPPPPSGAPPPAVRMSSSAAASSAAARVTPTIAQRSGAIDYASAAKSGAAAAAAVEGSFAAALAGPRAMVPKVEKPMAVTTSGASVPAPRFAPVVAAAAAAAPAFQFGTGSTGATGDGVVGASGGISFGTKAPAMPIANAGVGMGDGATATGAAKAYPKPEFAFGSGASAVEASTPTPGAGFVPPVPSGPPPVPAGRPPEANQRGAPQTHVAPGFGFTQPSFGLARSAPPPAKPPTNAWGAAVAAAPATEWDMSMGMGLDIASSTTGMGTYDALGGPSPFGGFGGLGALFSQSGSVDAGAGAPLDDGANVAAAPPGMWGAGGYGF